MADSLAPVASRSAGLTIGALGFILAVTVAWWALALWPAPGAIPAWLERARAVCFGIEDNGLPSGAGWMLLIGEPFAMLIALAIIAGPAMDEAGEMFTRRASGRVALGAGVLLLVASAVAAGVRVMRATGAVPVVSMDDTTRMLVPMDSDAPALELQDQGGARVTLRQFRGHAAIVAFAYAHCETVCPIIVHEVLDARSRFTDDPPAVLVVTLDPWRDVPTRLPAIATQWQLPADAHVLSGSVQEVERTLDGWGISRVRDTDTGELVHGTKVFVVSPAGQLTFETGPYADSIAEAVKRALKEPGT